MKTINTYSSIILRSFLFLFMLSLFSCRNNNKTEKHPDFSQNIIDVSNKIVPIKTDLILGRSNIITVGKYLILTNCESYDKGFVIFDKNTLKPIVSGGSKGQGPKEIIAYDNVLTVPNTVDNQSFYAFDYSQRVLYKYAIDSMINTPNYLPREILTTKQKKAIAHFGILNDSIFLGLSLRVKKHAIIEDIIRYNYRTRKAQPFGYNHPESRKSARRTRGHFALSPHKDKYVMGFHYIDLMTICDIEGNLICNIYGPNWGKDLRKRFNFYGSIKIGKHYILASYLGKKGITKDKNGQLKAVSNTKLLIFDSKGNYIKSIDLKEPFGSFCFDELNHRIIFSLSDRDDPLGYINLKDILL